MTFFNGALPQEVDPACARGPSRTATTLTKSCCVVMAALTLNGCSTLISYRAQSVAENQTLKYVQGVGTLAVKNEDHEIFMYPTFKTQGATQPTFTIGYANNSTGAVDFSPENIKAYFRGAPVPIYTFTEKVDEIQSEKRGKQIALAILGGLAAGAAAYGASHQTYRSNYSGAVWSRRGSIGFAGSNTLRVYDPMSGIVAGAAVGGAAGLGVRQLEYNAQTQEQAANSILQANTVDPMRMVTGDLILKNCCDPFPKPDDVIRFEITANNQISVFEFARVSANAPAVTPNVVARSARNPAAPAPLTTPAPQANPTLTVSTPTVMPASGASPVSPVPPRMPVTGGQDGFSAEKLAKTRNCSAQPSAVLVAKGPGYESYSVACNGGEALAIRCEFGNCRVLQ